MRIERRLMTSAAMAVASACVAQASNVSVTSSYREVYAKQFMIEMQDDTTALGPWNGFVQVGAVTATQDTHVYQNLFGAGGQLRAEIEFDGIGERVGSSDLTVHFDVLDETTEFRWGFEWITATGGGGSFRVYDEDAGVPLVEYFVSAPANLFDGVGPEGGTLFLDPGSYSVVIGVHAESLLGEFAAADIRGAYMFEWPTPGAATLLGIAAIAACRRRR